MLNKIFIVVLIFLPVTCWAFIKPARVLAPQWNGLTCVSEEICIEDVDSANRAKALYEEVLHFTLKNIGTVEHLPKVSFCLTDSCFRSFGFNSPAKAKAIGTYGIVVGPEGWKSYILCHEFIHHIQSERLGNLTQWSIDDWFKEGMAYSMSEDPREISGKRQEYVEKFESWYSSIDKNELWVEAKQL